MAGRAGIHYEADIGEVAGNGQAVEQYGNHMSSCDMAAGEDVLRVCYEQVGEDELQQARHDGLPVHGLLLWSKGLMI